MPDGGYAPAAAEVAQFWDLLLSAIDGGTLVPVVGEELLATRLDGRDVLLYDGIAERLARAIGVPYEPGETLSCVARRGIGRQNADEIYWQVHEVTKDLGDLPLPPSLLQLAGIEPLSLFLTTTFDGLLVSAIDRERFGGQPTTLVRAFSPELQRDDERDLPADGSRPERPVAYHLLGRRSVFPEYAITEEDVLEWIHALQTERGQPQRLFRELSQRNLLLLGTGFGGWLARFFLRATKGWDPLESTCRHASLSIL